eukprot:6374232-Prymnesium_polylepis.1
MHVPTWAREAAYNGLVRLGEMHYRNSGNLRKRDLLLQFVDNGAVRRVAVSMVSGMAILARNA